MVSLRVQWPGGVHAHPPVIESLQEVMGPAHLISRQRLFFMLTEYNIKKGGSHEHLSDVLFVDVT